MKRSDEPLTVAYRRLKKSNKSVGPTFHFILYNMYARS